MTESKLTIEEMTPKELFDEVHAMRKRYWELRKMILSMEMKVIGISVPDMNETYLQVLWEQVDFPHGSCVYCYKVQSDYKPYRVYFDVDGVTYLAIASEEDVRGNSNDTRRTG